MRLPARPSSTRPSGARRTWSFRVLAALLGYAVLDLVLAGAGFEPNALRLALLVLVCATGASLLLDSSRDGGQPWPDHTSREVLPRGADPRLGAHVRLIEDHLTARTPDSALRDRLVELSGGRLAEELAGELGVQPRRLSRREIDDYLKRIEEQ